MRILRGRGWLAVVAVALGSTEAAFVTFIAGFTEPTNQYTGVVYAKTPNVFAWTTDASANVVVDEISLWSISDNGDDKMVISRKASGSGNIQTPPTTTTTAAAATTSSSKNGEFGRSIEDGASSTQALALDYTSITSVSIFGFSGSSLCGQPLYMRAVSSKGVDYSRRFTVAQNSSQFTELSQSTNYSDPSPYVPKSASISGNDQSPNGISGGGGSSTTSGSAGGGSTQTAAAASSGGGLSSGAVIGIAVACGVVGLLLVFALVWFLLRRRQQKRDLHPVDSSYASGNRTDELMAEKEAGADVDVAPHSPYSDEGMSAAGPSGTYQDDAAHGGAVAAGAVAVGTAAAHRALQQDQARSYTPYSDRPSPGGTGAAGTPIARPESVAHTDEARVSVPSATPGRATPRALTTPYAHLVEEGMTEEEIRRLEDEERQLDAAIEQAGRR